MNHGDVGTKLYNTWRGMLNRVTNESYIDSHRYVKRGITVYDPWRKYLVFKEWAMSNGYSEGLQIDRRDNDKGYHPDNCRFVDSITNVNNRSTTRMVTYRGETQSLMLLLRKLDLLDRLIAVRNRLRYGWDHTRAIDTPVRNGNYANR